MRSEDFTAWPGVAEALRALLMCAFSTLDSVARGKMVPQSVMEMFPLLEGQRALFLLLRGL